MTGRLLSVPSRDAPLQDAGSLMHATVCKKRAHSGSEASHPVVSLVAEAKPRTPESESTRERERNMARFPTCGAVVVR